jgi:hypothetical protein
MITDKGKEIIGKYLLGQAPAFASYIAIGCGVKPGSLSGTPADYSDKNNLDFEMIRVPISSRGFVTENNIDKIVFTAELPTEERYEITEVGIFSAKSNPAAGSYDSRTIFSFTTGENWNHHTATATPEIKTYFEALDDPEDDNIIAVTDKVFQTNADNPIFYKQSRAEKFERCRFLNNVIIMRGDDANLTPGTNEFTIGAGSNHIHYLKPNVDFSKNSPKDQIRLAFSVVNKDGGSPLVPETVRVLVMFAASDSVDGEHASFEVDMTNGSAIGQYDFSTNRYFVISKELQDLYTTGNFTWNSVDVVKIYVSIFDEGSLSDDYYVALDAMRIENVATVNPLYGMTGYSIIRNVDEESIVKSPNTSNYVEFRFSIGVT